MSSISLTGLVHVLELLIENQEEIVDKLKEHNVWVPQKHIRIERLNYDELRG